MQSYQGRQPVREDCNPLARNGIGRTTLPRVAALALGTVLFAAGCHAASSQSATNPAASDPSATGGPQLSAAWNSVLDQIGPDGAVSTDTALQAFALAFGPMPGVNTPPGEAGVIPDGSFAVRWLMGHWTQLTSAQRAAAVKLVPDLAHLSDGSGHAGTASAGGDPQAALIHTAALRLRAPQRSDFFYEQYANQEAKDIAAKVGHPLDLPLTAHVGLTTDATSLAETVVLDANNDQQGAPAKCIITFSAAGDKLLGDDLAQTMAHEVWHCFEGEYGGTTRLTTQLPAWIVEGESEWVGDALYPKGLAVSAKFWNKYLSKPDKPLFSRAYDAVGFYSQLQQSGVDVWSSLIPALQAKDSATAFETLDANTDAFLDRWASGYSRSPQRGAAWDIEGPAITPTVPTPVPLAVADGGSAPLQAPAYADQLYALNASSDILVVGAVGHVRVSDWNGNDYPVHGDASFCHRSDGCDCPNQTVVTPAPLDLRGTNVELALTGGPSGASGAVSGMTLDDFCTKKLTGTWMGTWQDHTPDNAAGTFTVTWKQTGNSVSGTIQVNGTGCIQGGTVQGTVNGQTITFGAVQGRVTITYTGTIGKGFNDMSGSYQVNESCSNAAGSWSAQRK